MMYETELINKPYKCEHPGCPKKAAVEWMCRDEDGELYYSYRCAKHPEQEATLDEFWSN